MKNFKLVLLVVIFLGFREALSDECEETADTGIEECDETEYTSYIDCVRRRTKRHAGCSQNCDSCDCNYCSSGGCNSHCNVCCANFEQPCQTKYCCYKTCHSQCSHQGCRDTCRRTCQDKINGKEPITQINTGYVAAGQSPNITTIINLHNKINNTNIIDVPINLKTDNINNITINTSQFGSNSSGGGDGQCCQVVSPRQCTPIREYPFMRCYHLRKRVCSNICRANIMHAQPHQICDQKESGPPDCHNQVIYIPQPQPRCSYKSEWPYVSCNIPTTNCEGCYEHYATNAPRPLNCPSSCYDDGHNVGPYYPQGPIYPGGGFGGSGLSCLQLGTCQPYYGGYGLPSGGGGGGFGAIPFNGAGLQPSAFENNFVVQRNAEVPDMSKLFSDFTQKDDYDAQTLPITNSITQPPSTLLVEPSLVKIETVNATDVFMTIKELNDDGSVGDRDVTTLATVPLTDIAGSVPSILSQGEYLNPNTVRYQRDDKSIKKSEAEDIDVMLADEGTKNKGLKTITTTMQLLNPKGPHNPVKLASSIF